MSKKYDTSIMFFIEGDTKMALEKEANSFGQTLSSFMRLMVNNYLAQSTSDDILTMKKRKSNERKEA